MDATEKLQHDYEELEADIFDVEMALSNLEIQPGKNAVWMRVGYTKYNAIGRVQVHVMRKALQLQKLSLESDLCILAAKLGKPFPL